MNTLDSNCNYSALGRAAPGRNIVMSVSVCLSVCLSDLRKKPTCTSFAKFCIHVTYGRGSCYCDDSAVRYVFPVLWMTSYFPIMAPKCGVTLLQHHRCDCSRVKVQIQWDQFRRNFSANLLQTSPICCQLPCNTLPTHPTSR